MSVRQVASYPQSAVTPGDLVLLQQGALGGPYISASAYGLVAGAMASGGPLGVGYTPPGNAWPAGIFAAQLVVPPGGGTLYNCYFDETQSPIVLRYWQSGQAGGYALDQLGTYNWTTSAIGIAGQPVEGLTPIMSLNPAGNLNLPRGTLSVARDPGSALEVATMGWVGANTLASFNGRKGTITLSAADIYGALGICPPDTIATQSSVDAQICAAINDLLRTYPSVWSWMGRVGDVFLTVADMNFAAANNPAFMPPLTIPTPPETAIDGEVVTAAWVIAYLGTTAGFATETWVDSQIAAAIAGTVASFNGRQGAVTLNLADVMGAGGAPLAGPSFSGIPTAPTANPGTNTAQIATTAYVMATLTAISPGVITFNTRSGAVTLGLADITNAGGAPVASPNFTGTPAAPTAPQGTSTSQIATTAFVMGEIAATTAGVVSFNGRSGVVTLQLADITAAGGAPLNNPAFTGQPAAPTAPNGTSSAQLATTAFVMNEINAISAGVTTFNGRSGAVTLTANDVTAVGGLANPSAALSGTPTAPTPAANDSSTNIATTAFVAAAIANVGGGYLPIVGGVSMTGLFSLSGNATANLNPVPLQQLTSTLTAYATTAAVAASFAPLASPALTGTPTVPTAPAGTATTQAASTQFVGAAIASAPFIPQNYVDNSGFTVNQRGYQSGTATTTYGFDRWRAGASGVTLTFTASPASTIVTIAAGSLQQPIEGANILGQPYTLSWTGTATGRTAVQNTNPTGPYAASPITFTPLASTAVTIEFTGGTVGQVQLQLGTRATPWQPQAYEVELARCQRFFYQTTGGAMVWAGAPAAVGAGCGYTFVWPTTMRVAPSVSLMGAANSGANAGGAWQVFAAPDGVYISVTSTAANAGGTWSTGFGAAADL